MKSAKAKVLKSKSSNSAMTKSGSVASSRTPEYSHSHGHKSRSSGEFPPTTVTNKKKGMYVDVDKRSAKGSLPRQDSSNKPSPPRRAKTTFMASILTILDQGTQGTQTSPERRRTRRRGKSTGTNAADETLESDVKKSQHSIKKDTLTEEKKTIWSGLHVEKSHHTINILTVDKRTTREFRSKVPKNFAEFNQNQSHSNDFIMAPNKNMTVKSNEDFTATFLNNSILYKDASEGFFGQLADEDLPKQLLHDIHRQANVNLNTSVETSAIGLGKKKILENFELNVSDKQETKDKLKVDFYNTFLETFGYRNVDGQPLNNNAGNELEGDDSKTKHSLNVQAFKNKVNHPEAKVSNVSIKEKEIEGYHYNETANHDEGYQYDTGVTQEGYHVQDDSLNWNNNQAFPTSIFPDLRNRYWRHKTTSNKLNQPSSLNKFFGRGMKSDLLATPTRFKNEAKPKVQNVIRTERSHKVHNKKIKLLHILKDELTKPVDLVEEPRNMFQALKIVAKNKKKQQKEIRFAEVPKVITNTRREDEECCRYKGHKVLKMFKKNKIGPPSKNIARPIQDLRALNAFNDGDESVYDYDYYVESDNAFGIRDTYGSYATLDVKDYEIDLPGHKAPTKKILYATNTSDNLVRDVNDMFVRSAINIDYEEDIDIQQCSKETGAHRVEISTKTDYEDEVNSLNTFRNPSKKFEFDWGSILDDLDLSY